MKTSILYCLVTGSAITDILKNKIFNTWLIIGCVLGIAFSFFENGPDTSIKMMIIKAFITFMIFLPIYLIKGIGGGDLKLLTIISLFLTPGEFITSIAITFIVGAIIGTVKVVIKRNIHQTVHFAVPIMISILLVTSKSALICM